MMFYAIGILTLLIAAFAIVMALLLWSMERPRHQSGGLRARYRAWRDLRRERRQRAQRAVLLAVGGTIRRA